MTETTTTPFPYAGTVSHGTLREEDLVPTFLGVLADLDPKWEFKHRLEFLDTIALLDVFGTWDMSLAANERAGHLMESLFDALDAVAPDGFYFGAVEGDGSDFGFWMVDDGTDPFGEDDEPDWWGDGDGLTDVEADCMTLTSAGWGSDEDYGMIGGDSDLMGEW